MKTKKFGVEIGCLIKSVKHFDGIATHNAVQIILPSGWKAERDSSIYHKNHPVGGEENGFQVVSRPYTDLKKFLIDLCQILPKLSFNVTCGLHVHVASKNKKDARYKVLSGTVEDIYPASDNYKTIVGCVVNSLIR